MMAPNGVQTGVKGHKKRCSSADKMRLTRPRPRSLSKSVLVNAGDGGEFGGEAEAAPPERSSCPAFGLLGGLPGSGELEMVES
ncbi:hypothetical protein E4U31_008222 [Claviceps sp. LM219 group G6]|nr:hypothetical protein E4U31_008222 [Claviceps sp. LM219 group G6]